MCLTFVLPCLISFHCLTPAVFTNDLHLTCPSHITFVLPCLISFHCLTLAVFTNDLHLTSPSHITFVLSCMTSFRCLTVAVSTNTLMTFVWSFPQACQDNVCLDLSFSGNHGRLQGQKCVTWDIKVGQGQRYDWIGRVWASCAGDREFSSWSSQTNDL